jgi:putative hydrolase of the HAD superfamily
MIDEAILFGLKKYKIIWTKMKDKIKVVGFDADDTLWVNEPYYRQTENHFYKLLKDFIGPAPCGQKLLETEIKNIELYGFGAKSFVLSLIETAITVSNSKISAQTIKKIIDLGKEQILKPVELLDDVQNTLESLKNDYRLIVATKGDLLDQERKLNLSGLAPYFHHIEVMSDKKEEDYQSLLQHLDIRPDEFIMIGNSLKSDILPVLAIGGYAVHVPYHTTWAHEVVEDENIKNPRFKTITKVVDILGLLQ